MKFIIKVMVGLQQEIIFNKSSIIVKRYFLDEIWINRENIISISKMKIETQIKTIPLVWVKNSREIIECLLEYIEIENKEDAIKFISDGSIIYMNEDLMLRGNEALITELRIKSLVYSVLILGVLLISAIQRQLRLEIVIAVVIFLFFVFLASQYFKETSNSKVEWIVNKAYNLMIYLILLLISVGITYSIYKIGLILGFDIGSKIL